MPASRTFRVTALSISMLILLAACAIQPVPPVATIERITSTDLATVQQEAMKAAAKVGIDNVLVIFDIDNTLLAMEQDLGSDQWYDWQKELQTHDRCDERLVADRLAAAGALYYASGMRPTQPDAAEIVRTIQARGFTTFALTSRGHEFRLHTFREFRRNGIDFEDSAPGPKGGYPGIYMPEGGVRPARYEDGIMLTAGQDKGVMLDSLLKKTGHKIPQILIAVDDKPNHLVAYGDFANKYEVSLVAIEYTGEAEVLETFDGEEVTRQWQAIIAALDTLQREFGTDNYELPDSHAPEGCPARQ